MGRGLSELQKRILTIIYERRRGRDLAKEEREWHEKVERDPFFRKLYEGSERSYRARQDLMHPEIIAALYDWPIMGRSWAPSEKRGLRASEGGRVQAWTHNWSRRHIGFEEYNRKTAAYYRAVGRLKRRGLLEDRVHGLWITDEGIRTVEELMVSRHSPTSDIF
jgi:hypothetical protein